MVMLFASSRWTIRLIISLISSKYWEGTGKVQGWALKTLLTHLTILVLFWSRMLICSSDECLMNSMITYENQGVHVTSRTRTKIRMYLAARTWEVNVIKLFTTELECCFSLFNEILMSWLWLLIWRVWIWLFSSTGICDSLICLLEIPMSCWKVIEGISCNFLSSLNRILFFQNLWNIVR